MKFIQQIFSLQPFSPSPLKRNLKLHGNRYCAISASFVRIWEVFTLPKETIYIRCDEEHPGKFKHHSQRI